jgi:hypothetical protein
MEHDADALCRNLEAEIHAQVDAVGDVIDGVTLRHEHAARWAFVLPDVNWGRWRVQAFDERSFVGHSLLGTTAEAVRSMMRAGDQHRDDRALDRVAVLPSFQRGNYIATPGAARQQRRAHLQKYRGPCTGIA